jgi:hypothetical protein
MSTATQLAAYLIAVERVDTSSLEMQEVMVTVADNLDGSTRSTSFMGGSSAEVSLCKYGKLTATHAGGKQVQCRSVFPG